MSIIDVVVGIILDASKSKVLVAQRNSDDEHYGQWEFPGGKIDTGESIEDALKRELKEELNLDIIAIESFKEFEFEYTQRKVNLKFLLVTDFDGVENGNEGQKIQWVDIKDLHQINMLEANKSIVDQLRMKFL